MNSTYKGRLAISRFNPIRFFFFLAWGFKVGSVSQKHPRFTDVRDHIREAILKITPEMLASVFHNAADQF
jgi:hypothetical protein